MIDCTFTIQVWQHIGNIFATGRSWQGNHITEAFLNWISGGARLRNLPFHVCRYIWLARNSIIFRDNFITPLQIANKVQAYWNEGPRQNSPHKTRIIQPPSFKHDMAFGYFDGASQDGGNKCGVGAILISPLLGRYNIKWNCGFGTNSRSELLALWSLLHLARSLDIEAIQIAGDSMIIVEWFRGKFELELIQLTYWMDRILMLKGQFLEINIQHVYREMNSDADYLSKMALAGPVGHFLVARGDGSDPSSYVIFGTY